MKKNVWRQFAWSGGVVIVIAVSVFFIGFRQSEGDYFLKINKSLEIFGRVYREVTMNYVDEVDPGKFMEAGIDGMLETLDPYTNFISESEGDEVELITSGKYGGIGVTIGLRDGKITVLSVMDGYSAQRQGVEPGDRILAIDGTSMEGMKPENVRGLTRGEPGTELHVMIDREGEPKPLEFVLVREEIQLHNISYAGFIQPGIAYVRIDRFSRGAGDELRLAIKQMRIKGEIKGFILDLRDNPGGLLDVAVDVVEKFAPKGSLVVSTRGRHPESERKYYVMEEPLLPDVPLVVLVNRNSASASEIVAGAIQDLDRGVIVGTRTFGKGLVQTITPLAYNTQLKMTTAKYYTPSGRCIQEIDYQHRTNDGVFAPTPDSLRRSFKTLNGRKEMELGGIQPDSLVPEEVHTALYNDLLRKSMFLRYAVHVTTPSAHVAAMKDEDSLLTDFRQFLRDQHFSFQQESETKLQELRDVLAKSTPDPKVTDALDHLKQLLQPDLPKEVARDKDELVNAINAEVAGRTKGEQGKIEVALASDNQVIAAEGLVKNAKQYAFRLTVH